MLFTNEHRVDGIILIVEERWVLKSIIITIVNWQVKHRTEVCYGLQQQTFIAYIQQNIQFSLYYWN